MNRLINSLLSCLGVYGNRSHLTGIPGFSLPIFSQQKSNNQSYSSIINLHKSMDALGRAISFIRWIIVCILSSLDRS